MEGTPKKKVQKTMRLPRFNPGIYDFYFNKDGQPNNNKDGQPNNIFFLTRWLNIVTPTWGFLNKLGQSHILKSSYFWLFFVPIAAKVISKLPNEIIVEISKKEYTILLKLPFNWQVLYLAALCFSIANIIYILCCPKIIADHRDFADFLASGKKKEQLEEYIISTETEAETEAEIKKNPEDSLRNQFWIFYSEQAQDRSFFRFLCFYNYLIGLTLILQILVTNTLFVLQNKN